MIEDWIYRKIAETKYSWYAKGNRETTSSDSYFREVTPEDKRDFKLAVWKNQDGEVQSKMRCYYNPKTQEISGQHPKDVLPRESS